MVQTYFHENLLDPNLSESPAESAMIVSRFIVQQTSSQGHIFRVIPYGFILLRLKLRGTLTLMQWRLGTTFPL